MLICGKGFGKLIFDDVESYAVRHNIPTITLKPANEALKQLYLTRYGFSSKNNVMKRNNTFYKPIVTPVLKNKTTLKSRNKGRYTRKYTVKRNTIVNNLLNPGKFIEQMG